MTGSKHSNLDKKCVPSFLISKKRLILFLKLSSPSPMTGSKHSNLDKKCSIFFDLKKAFDSVPHRRLIDKLSSYGLDAHTLSWITSYLTNRKQHVVVGGESSLDTPVLSGVPQGSVLGPLLFLIYIDDVSDSLLSDGSMLNLYADDMLLYKPVKSPEDFKHLQSDIDHISDWVSCNNLTLNPNKCKFMIISRKTNSVQPPQHILNDTPLEQVETFKYLGVLLSSELSWSVHVESICTKASKLIGLLYRIASSMVMSISRACIAYTVHLCILTLNMLPPPFGTLTLLRILQNLRMSKSLQ